MRLFQQQFLIITNFTPEFKDSVTNLNIEQNEIPDFVNRYFVNITDQLNIDNTSIRYPDLHDLYDFMMYCLLRMT